ncbi:hypothetical protein BU14_0048s0033 [Porphyra umbilicalis]|uniref:Secreted protein n=1 Tax=Porphyra umbilicalis TaxID=2786 RepID=A0A1X6PIU4_PORUM|nr:hypothetical protein BU14_0048s0033 [Porphyra umbilicalis]|eukprot:OSX80618.1 hypothetical protein BU14_0048s0033 [Porphyra umbilicalis]
MCGALFCFVLLFFSLCYVSAQGVTSCSMLTPYGLHAGARWRNTACPGSYNGQRFALDRNWLYSPLSMWPGTCASGGLRDR